MPPLAEQLEKLPWMQPAEAGGKMYWADAFEGFGTGIQEPFRIGQGLSGSVGFGSGWQCFAAGVWAYFRVGVSVSMFLSTENCLYGRGADTDTL